MIVASIHFTAELAIALVARPATAITIVKLLTSSTIVIIVE